MVLYTGGSFIPGRPAPAKPAPTANPAPKRVDTSTLAGVLAASGRPTANPTPRYIPSYAKGAALEKQQQENNAAIASGLVPKPTRSTLGTGSIESKSAKTQDGTTYRKPKTDTGTGSTEETPKAEKPLEVVLGQEEMDAAQQAADALRTFQENQARMQLQQVLGKIDRAAIEQYKGISEDYAARGLARSGGKLQTEQKAIDERDRAVGEATQAVTDFLNELKLTGNLEQASTNLGKSQAFQDYISGRLSPAMGE